MFLNKNLIIVLHEIYGVNSFMRDVINSIRSYGFDAICPNLLNRVSFEYNEEKQAYSYYNSLSKNDSVEKINELIKENKKKYNKVFLIGFSVGATLAWRCSMNIQCDGIIAFYGSRIRDELDVNPNCNSVLIFSNEDSFDVDEVIKCIQSKEKCNVIRVESNHGFMDKYSMKYNEKAKYKIIQDIKRMHPFE